MTNKSTATTNGNCSSSPTGTSQTITTTGANTTSAPSSESNNNNNNNETRRLAEESSKILATAHATQQLSEHQRAPQDGPAPPPALEPQVGGGVEPRRESSTSDIEQQLNKGTKIEPIAGAPLDPQSSLKSEPAPPASDGNNNQEAQQHGRAPQVKHEPVELAPDASIGAPLGADHQQMGHQMIKTPGELQGAGSESGTPIKGEPHQERLANDDNSPEYTMLKPVEPTGSQQQQHQAQLIQEAAHQQHPQNSSTLTDLDAADQANTHRQNGLQHQVESGSISIEQHQQQPASSLAPLTELAPAAVGTTFSELTSVNPVTIDHHPQQQYLSEQHDPQQQQQHLQQAHPNLVGGGAGDQELHQMAYASAANYQLGGTGLLQQQQHQAPPPQTMTPLGACPSDNPPGSTFSQHESTQPANVMPSIQRFQTTRPASASSLTSSGGMTTPTGAGGPGSTAGASSTGGGGGSSKRRSWSQVNRNANKTEIAKVYSQFGFRCYLEAPISTCRRKEEDRITYINKGEFYGLTLDYVPDAGRPLRSSIVKAVVMLVFRDEKTPEEDLKSWQFWHSRQHSAKQRILDVDNKNHVNVINQIEEVSLNAIAFYWNPLETRQAKLNIAIQCLSTDFSNQKGVKGLPLNLQVDIYDLFTETSTPVYRAYSTLLSYCDKGAQRRSRDEERRVLKRKLADQSGGSAASAAKKFDDLYHKPCDRTEFYAMADLIKAPTLYSPTEAEALGLAAQGAASDTNSSSGANTNPSIKQPMSQASAISVTPIAATTPIPATILHDPQQQQQQQPQLIQQQQPVGLAYGQTTAGLVGNAQQLAQAPRAGLPQAQFAHSPYTSTPAAVVTGDYMAPVASSAALLQGGQMVASLGPNSQQQQTGSMAQQQQQQHQMIGQSATIHHQHHQVAGQHQHQQQHQQQHHYHQMTSSALQPSYGIIQTGQPVVDQSQQQQQQQQQQQYAILQPSVGMSVHHATSSASHLHSPHANQYATHQQQQQQQQQQPMMTSGSGQQQQHPSLEGNRGQMHHGSMMMAGGMVQQQQQHQIQAQHGQYMGAGAPPQPANNLANLTSAGSMSQHQQHQQPLSKRAKLYPNERVLIYAKQADEKDFYPLHLSPPSLSGLVYAIEQKYKIDSTKVANIYKKSKKGIRVQMDDEMIRHYCNEDMVQLEVVQTQDSRLEITLVEL